MIDPKRPMRRLVRLVATASAVAVGISCQDDSSRIAAPPPVVPLPTSPIKPNADYGPVGGAISVPLSSPTDPSGSAQQLPYFAKTTLIRVTVTGSISTTLTPFNDGAPNQPQAPGAPRTFGPGGYYWGSPSYSECGAQVRVWYSTESFWPACASDRGTDTASSVSAHIYAQGLGSASRTGAAPGTSGANDCWYYAANNFYSGTGPCFYYSSGGQTVTIERVGATLNLTASETNPDYQDTVTFTASVSPTSAGGKNIPWQIESVQWTTDDGSYSGWSQPCAWNSFQPNGTGAACTVR